MHELSVGRRRPNAGEKQEFAHPPPTRRFTPQKPRLCFKCQQPGHFARVCPNQRPDRLPYKTESSTKLSSSEAPRNTAAPPQSSGKVHRKTPTPASQTVHSCTDTKDHSPLSSSGTGKRNASFQGDDVQNDCRKRIEELEEMVQQQRRQIEDLTKQLEACRCGREET